MKKDLVKKKYQKKIKELNHYNKKYFNENVSEITDSEFDQLKKDIILLERDYKFLKHKNGDFPVTDAHTKKIITFPCDQHLSSKQMQYIVKCVKSFYK